MTQCGAFISRPTDRPTNQPKVQVLSLYQERQRIQVFPPKRVCEVEKTGEKQGNLKKRKNSKETRQFLLGFLFVSRGRRCRRPSVRSVTSSCSTGRFHRAPISLHQNAPSSYWCSVRVRKIFRGNERAKMERRRRRRRPKERTTFQRVYSLSKWKDRKEEQASSSSSSKLGSRQFHLVVGWAASVPKVIIIIIMNIKKETKASWKVWRFNLCVFERTGAAIVANCLTRMIIWLTGYDVKLYRRTR